jgi:hypothetical protein
MSDSPRARCGDCAEDAVSISIFDPMHTMMSNAYLSVDIDPAQGILRFTRTSVPYTSHEDLLLVHQQIGQMFDRLGRARHVLLVDMRKAPLNNGADFEAAAARGRAILVRGFSHVAVLVQTATGMLQINRHLREDGVSGQVFTEEEEALAYLRRVVERREGGESGPSSGVGRVQGGPFDHLARLAGKR